MAKKAKKQNSADVGFEETLWAAADKMRNNMDPAEYKHVVLGLIFLKYISDSFEEVASKIKKDPEYYEGQEEDKDAYLSENVFWVPQKARWEYIKNSAKKPEIGKIIDDAMISIEKDNPNLKGVLSKNYARPDLDKVRLGELIDLMSTITLGDKASRSKDILGRIYEYFLGRFAGAEGKGGGEFFTPQSVVKLLVQMIEPFKGRVYDPCCGSGGMFVQSEKFVEAHGGNTADLAIYGQESNPTTWRLCKMNLAIRGIEGNLGIQNADTFHNDLHKELKADFILANPPFNISDWGGERLKDDVRWKYGIPPAGNANYAWIQHIIHHLSPSGIAGFVLANGSLSSNTSGEGEIRKNLIKAGLVDCIVAMPSQLFYTTQIPACLWFVSRDRYDHKFRNRHDEILFIDARGLGTMRSKSHREFTEEDINLISSVYHNWRNIKGGYSDQVGFCKAVTVENIEKNGFVLSPAAYVGTESLKEDAETFKNKIGRFAEQINTHYQTKINLEERAIDGLEKLLPGLKNIKLITAENSVLEEINQSIFKNWFIDFEFPDRNGNPYKANGGELIESEMGKIPVGWQVKTIGNVAGVIDCLHSKKPLQQKTGKLLLQLWNIKDLGLLDLSEPFFISEDDYNFWISRIEATQGDCVITNVGRVGAVAQVPHGLRFALGRNMTAIRCKKEFLFPTFLIEHLVSPEFKSEMKRKIDTGTILDALNVRNIPKLRIILPPSDLIKKYESFAYPIRRIMEENLKQTYQKYLLKK